MQSANLSFSMPFFKKQVRRFWPLWSLYSLLLFMLLPMYLLLQSQSRFLPTQGLATDFHNYLLNLATYGSLWINFSFCILAAMALWSYLYNNRSVSMIHALPLSRGTLFVTNYVTGLLFSIVPSLVMFLLALGTQAIIGTVTLHALLLWLLCQTLFSIFFFSFATFFAFVTGHILALPAFYVIFNVLTAGISTLLDSLFYFFVYGYSSGSLPLLTDVGNWGSPLVSFIMKMNLQYSYHESGLAPPAELRGLGMLGIYAAVGVVLAVLAFFLYRRRSLELSGEVITVRALRPVFKYGVAVCAGLTLGSLFYQLFEDVFPRGVGSLLFFLLLWAAIGYFASEMLLRKSFRVFRKSAPGALALLLLLSAAVLAMEYDLTGYEKSAPDSATVQSVLLTGNGTGAYENPGDLVSVLALHKTLIAEKSVLEAQIEDFNRQERIAYTMDDSNELNQTSRHISFLYTLKDGSVFRRNYQIPLSVDLLAQSDSPAAQYQSLINIPSVVLNRSFPKDATLETLVELRLDVPNYTKKALAPSTVPGVSFGTNGEMILSGEAKKRLYAAVREDIAAGRLEQTHLVEDLSTTPSKVNCINSIYFSFRVEYNEEDTPALGLSGRTGTTKPTYSDLNITLQSSASSTIAMLKSFGLVPGVHILTYQEVDEQGYYKNDTHQDDDYSTESAAVLENS